MMEEEFLGRVKRNAKIQRKLHTHHTQTDTHAITTQKIFVL